uniref:Uncharacterized protein n=1 Tax=Tetranychus urticae TaxID=32264 RepID=T1JT62_TETUR
MTVVSELIDDQEYFLFSFNCKQFTNFLNIVYFFCFASFC